MTTVPSVLRRAPSPVTVRFVATSGRDVGRDGRLARDPWPDNVRLVAAVLVVVMHALEPVLARSETATALYWATWPARIPVFVMVAGYFSDARPLDHARIEKLLRSVLGVYLAVDGVAFLRRGLVDDVWRYEPFVPAFGMWFLLSLFTWRLLLPLIVRVRGFAVLAVIAALGVGFFGDVGAQFSAARTATYLPLFLGGWWLRQAGARAWWAAGAGRRLQVRVLAAFTLAGVMAVLVSVRGRVSKGELRLLAPYRGGWEEQLAAAGVRGVLLLLGAAGATAVVLLVPTRRLPVLTALGSGAMYVYVLHPLLVSQARSMNLFAEVTSAGDLVLLVLGAVGVALLLASAWVRWATGWFVQPRRAWWLQERGVLAAQAPAPVVCRPAERGGGGAVGGTDAASPPR